MIKAEVISHEGNPGPNWLDRCRSVTTPVNATVVALLIIGGVLFVGLVRKDQAKTANQLPATSNSQQASQPNTSVLQVQPLDKAVTTSNGNSAVQPAAGVSSRNTSTQNRATSPFTASPTPYFNNSRSKEGAKSNKSSQKPLQSTTQDIQDDVDGTVRGITDGLGL